MLYIQCSGWDYDDMLWNGSEEDGNVGGECEGDGGIAFEGGDSDTNW